MRRLALVAELLFSIAFPRLRQRFGCALFGHNTRASSRCRRCWKDITLK